MAVAVEPLGQCRREASRSGGQRAGDLAQGRTMRAKAIPHLRKFCKHEKPQSARRGHRTLFARRPPTPLKKNFWPHSATRKAKSASPRPRECWNYSKTSAVRLPIGAKQGIHRGSGIVVAQPSVDVEDESVLSKVARFFGGAARRPSRPSLNLPTSSQPRRLKRPRPAIKTTNPARRSPRRRRAGKTSGWRNVMRGSTARRG